MGIPSVGRALPRRISRRRGLHKFAAEHSPVIIITLTPAVAETPSVVRISVSTALNRVINLTKHFRLFFVVRKHGGSGDYSEQFL
jgi:hypothetical protein